MQQIYRHSDEHFEVFTTVFSPQVCRSRTRRRHVGAEKVEVVALQYRARCAKELDLNRGDLIQVLFREDDTWWFGRLADEREGYFPAACVEPLEWSTDLSEGGASSQATPTLLRRGSVPTVGTAGAPCGCTSGRSTPKLLRRNSTRRPPGHDEPSPAPTHCSPSLLHRVLAKSRRKSCPHFLHPPPDNGSINTVFQPD